MPRRDLTEHLLNPLELDEKKQHEARRINIEKSTLRLDPNRTALMRFAQGFCKAENVSRVRCLAFMSGMMDGLTQSRVTVNRASLRQIQITRGHLNYENLSCNAIETSIAPRVLDMPNPYLRPAPFALRLRVNSHDGIGPERA
jgi:hypothetical protein